MAKGKAIPYSHDELAFLKINRDLVRRELHAEFCAKFGRDDVSLGAMNGLMKRKGWMTGRTGRIEPGQVPHNKGVPMRPETKAKLARTWFQPGGRPHTYRGPGHEFVCPKDGYTFLIVAAPETRRGTRRVLKHKHLWEQANGPVPEGHALKSLDGDRTNCDPANWVAVPRALLPRLAGYAGRGKRVLAYDEAAPEARPAVLAIAKLAHAAREGRAPA